MQKNYKIPSMHQFSNHISKTLRSGYKKLAPNNVNTFYFAIGQQTKNHFVVLKGIIRFRTFSFL